MGQVGNRYCKIFTTAPESELKALLVKLLGGQFDRRVLTAPGLGVEVEVRGNPDTEVRTVTGFLGWPLLVEMEEDEPGGSAIEEVTAAVIQALWDSGREAVAACDFEDRLPWNGGTRRPGQS